MSNAPDKLAHYMRLTAVNRLNVYVDDTGSTTLSKAWTRRVRSGDLRYVI